MTYSTGGKNLMDYYRILLVFFCAMTGSEMHVRMYAH